ncbi:hypothetical protein Tco_0396694 [Tanacetum coccineum]
MNIDEDRHMIMVDDNVGNRFRENAVQNVGHLDGQHAVQNLGTQIVRNQNGLSVVQGIANQHRNGNVVAARAEGNANKNNNVENQVVQNVVQNPGVQNVRNQNGLLVVPGIANQNPNGNGNVVAARAEGNVIRTNADLDEIEEVNANCILMANLQQASTSGTQTDKAPVYDSDGSAEGYFGNFTLVEIFRFYINHLSRVFVSQTAKSREELSFSNTSKTANVSKSFSIPNEDFSDDTTPSVARKFLNEVKSTIVTLQRVVKQKMTLDIHNWSSSAHQEIHKIIKDEIFPIVNQVDARVQNFEIQFLKEAAKFVRDFQSLAKEADESLAKHKALELEIERLLRAVVSQDIMSIVQNNSVVDTSNLQTELERTKERFENCIIKKENEYAKLWNDWYKKCEECKYDKISYDKAYNDMQQKIERLQAQLGDQKGKSKDTPCVSNTLDPLPQKLENENVELEFQVRNYEKENAHLKTTYKNLFDSIKVTRAQTKAIIDSLQDKLHDTIYENAKLRAQLFDKVSEQKDTNKGTSVNTQFSKQSILGKPPSSSKPKLYAVTPLPKSMAFPKVGETNALINPFKASRVDNFVPNKHVKASVRTKPIAISQPHVVTKEDLNSNRNGFSLNNVESTTRTRRPQPKNNPNSDKECLITANHDECVLQYVNGMKSRKKNQSANVSKSANQKKHKPRVWKPKMVGSKEKLASPKPSTPRSCLRWSPTGRMFELKGKIIATSESECQSDYFEGDNTCTSNPQEPIYKRFPNSTFSMTGCQNWFDTLQIPLLSEYKSKDKETHGDNECEN